MKYYLIPTKKGKEKLAAANTGKLLQLESFKIGGDRTEFPDENKTDVNNVVYEGNINKLEYEEDILRVTNIIPASEGGFSIGEIGLFDIVGDMIFIANYPYQYVPKFEEGGIDDVVIPFEIKIQEKIISVELDPSVTLAFKKDIPTKISQLENDENYMSEIYHIGINPPLDRRKIWIDTGE